MAHSSAVPRTSHRPQRDARRNREIADLKRENHRLKREISRAQKRATENDIFNVELDPEPMTAAEPRIHCPECKSDDVASFETPSGAVRNTCRSCSVRF